MRSHRSGNSIPAARAACGYRLVRVGERVGLQAKDVVLRAQTEVDARVPTELQSAMRRQGQLLQLAREPRVQTRGEDLFRHPRRVLALVIEQLVLRNDLPDGEGHVPEDPHRHLAPRDELLDHDFVVVPLSERDGLVESLRALHERQPHRRPALARLHDHGPPECGSHVSGDHGRHEPRRYGDPRGAKQPFGQILVHGERAPERPAPRVRHTNHVEDGLERTAFTAAAMHREEQHVRLAHHRQAGEPVREHGAFALDQIADLRWCAAHVAAPEQAALVGLGEGPLGRVHDCDSVAPLSQRRHDLRRPRARHAALGGRPPREHGDPHQRMPASWWSTS